MDAERRREIARKGGKSVPDEKRSFTQDRTLAAEAGRKGGRQTQSGRTARGGGNGSGQTGNA
jgi:general stress protein YciG